jgi:hypothetical protein
VLVNRAKPPRTLLIKEGSTMPQQFARRTYDHWIGHNRSRFRFPPWVKESRKRSFTLGFTGLAPELTLQIQSGGDASVFVDDAQGVHWDILTDFDVFPQRTADGQYYCRLCEPPTHYPTRAALWKAHVFEPMLEWVNALTPDHRLWLYRQPGVSAARLIRLGEEERALKRVCKDLELFSRLVPVGSVDGKRPSIGFDGRVCIRELPVVLCKE